MVRDSNGRFEYFVAGADVAGIPDRLWGRVSPSADGCWLWTGAHHSGGYGVFRDANKLYYVHRYLHDRMVGEIPNGYQIDHLCRIRNCVNPMHLEPVTPRENVVRGIGASAANSRRTECVSGHALTGENLYLAASGRRQCKECARVRKRRYYAIKNSIACNSGDIEQAVGK